MTQTFCKAASDLYRHINYLILGAGKMAKQLRILGPHAAPTPSSLNCL